MSNQRIAKLLATGQAALTNALSDPTLQGPLAAWNYDLPRLQHIVDQVSAAKRGGCKPAAGSHASLVRTRLNC